MKHPSDRLSCRSYYLQCLCQPSGTVVNFVWADSQLNEFCIICLKPFRSTNLKETLTVGKNGDILESKFQYMFMRAIEHVKGPKAKAHPEAGKVSLQLPSPFHSPHARSPQSDCGTDEVRREIIRCDSPRP